ncbi:MAG: serine--tRNA ligase [Planctomycetota bacterium]|nr:MAG: serine--tRNA ligase [Planctomycetota bacterium]
MLDLQFVVENRDAVEANCRNRGVPLDLSKLLDLAGQRRALIMQGDDLRREQKEVSAQIPKAPAADKPTLISRGKELRELVQKAEADLVTVEEQLHLEQMQIPNMTHPDAPVGKLETESITAREWGTKRQFDFKPKDHVDLMAALDMVNLEAGSKVAGHGFYFLKNAGALLELALVNYAVEKLRGEGFDIYTTPDVARDEVLHGTGYMPRGPETQIYSLHNTDLSLVATAEITLGGMLRDEILDHAKLPLKVGGISHCFRTEAGGHGKATRGIYRVHQFTKVEMFGFTAPDLASSDALHQTIVRIEEEIFQGLEIPYRVLDICTGDLGGPAFRKYDLEAWMPGRGEAGEYGEITSASNCTDFQSRRLGIRTRVPEKKGTQYVHTLNGTAVACTRAMIAIIENHQQADGSIVVPPVLRKWMGMDRITA